MSSARTPLPTLNERDTEQVRSRAARACRRAPAPCGAASSRAPARAPPPRLFLFPPRPFSALPPPTPSATRGSCCSELPAPCAPAPPLQPTCPGARPLRASLRLPGAPRARPGTRCFRVPRAAVTRGLPRRYPLPPSQGHSGGGTCCFVLCRDPATSCGHSNPRPGRPRRPGRPSPSPPPAPSPAASVPFVPANPERPGARLARGTRLPRPGNHCCPGHQASAFPEPSHLPAASAFHPSPLPGLRCRCWLLSPPPSHPARRTTFPGCQQLGLGKEPGLPGAPCRTFPLLWSSVALASESSLLFCAYSSVLSPNAFPP